jgi:hypothetical protein
MKSASGSSIDSYSNYSNKRLLEEISKTQLMHIVRMHAYERLSRLLSTYL